ncbi:J domain-containing protein [Clostridium sp. HBUAS56010]|uniref:J domain-containing protein n=1 Tax=Clostridium sp. HBUAS56010 TaxID=2571127 RepID=UPI0011786B02|nr:J domain-containing protein [Clostridium sp. HBUAS56010]
MTAYFNHINTLEELRKQYKELLKRFHPDNPDGSTEATQAINAEYDSLFKELKDRHDNEADSRRTAYDDLKYDFAEDERLREVFQQVISFVGVNIMIVGAWIWIDGNTYGYRTKLSNLGFKWASDKKKWYFHTEAFRKRSHKKLSFKDIENYFGSARVEPEGKVLLQA